LSYDYQILEEILSEIDTDILNQNVNGLDGTAIWDAILLAEKVASRSKWDDANREQIIILLTDWDANRWVEPLLAAQSLAQKGVKVYSIGIGSKQGWTISFKSWPFVQQQRVPPLNEKDLREIAKLTNAKFYRAENNESLELIFEEIELLEKTEIETEISKVYSPAYKDFLWILTWLLLLLFGMQILLKD
jgi:Ca-activated chloride channel family protein